MSYGEKLPDTLSSFLAGSPFFYTVAVAPPYFWNGTILVLRRSTATTSAHTSRIPGRSHPRLTLDYGLRWDLYTPITERAHRTSSFRTINGTQQFVINPQPGYGTDWNAWGPRVQVAWQVTASYLLMPAAASWPFRQISGRITPLPAPRLSWFTRACFQPRERRSTTDFKITPAELPRAYTTNGTDIFASGKTNTVAPNTVMDVDRYEQDMAALTPGHSVSDLNLSGIDRSFGNGTLYTWTAGVERKFGNLTAERELCGHGRSQAAAQQLSQRLSQRRPGLCASHQI